MEAFSIGRCLGNIDKHESSDRAASYHIKYKYVLVRFVCRFMYHDDTVSYTAESVSVLIVA